MDNYSITLVNPFKKVAPIQLSPFDHGLCRCDKVTLSADPTTSPNDYVVAVIQNQNYEGYLCFKSARQSSWTVKSNLRFTDITFYKGLIYAVNRWKTVVSFKLCDSDSDYSCVKKMINPRPARPYEYNDSKVYLVKSLEGDLWMVERFMHFYHSGEDVYMNITKSFQVYKLKLDDQSGELLERKKLESLGDNVLFVGCGDSISVSASYFSNCLQKDSIYYTSEYADRSFVLEFYNVKDGSFDSHWPSSRWMMPSPMWILPQFQWD
ncbi:hypothetical protein SESBI_40123 [Sesbania bispinosa]|nr:hypothetical protein SESBI_40123 [Sesbania bispinosa]